MSRAILMGGGSFKVNGIDFKIKAEDELKKGDFFTLKKNGYTFANPLVAKKLNYKDEENKYSDDLIYGIVLQNSNGDNKIKVKFLSGMSYMLSSGVYS